MPLHGHQPAVFDLGNGVSDNVARMRLLAAGRALPARIVNRDGDAVVEPSVRPDLSSANIARLSLLADRVDKARKGFTWGVEHVLTAPFLRAINNVLIEDGVLLKRTRDDDAPHDRLGVGAIDVDTAAKEFDELMKGARKEQFSSRNDYSERSQQDPTRARRPLERHRPEDYHQLPTRRGLLRQRDGIYEHALVEGPVEAEPTGFIDQAAPGSQVEGEPVDSDPPQARAFRAPASKGEYGRFIVRGEYDVPVARAAGFVRGVYDVPVVRAAGASANASQRSSTDAQEQER